VNRRFAPVLVFIFVLVFASFAAPGNSLQTEKKGEPLSEASKQWLAEVVPYIVTTKEKEVFLTLPTEADRGRFIEAFWKKRDPNPQTPENEFKIEFYKRIAGANKLFGTGGITGWRTDRGKIYILLGPPKEIQRDSNPQPQGSTLVSVFQGPKETWQYWGLPNPNLPYNMEFVFVDKFGTGNYMLENTFRVESGRNNPFDSSNLTYLFDDQELMAEAQKNPFEGFDKLKEIITTQVSYTNIPFRSEVFYLKGAGKKTLIPLAIEISTAALASKKIEAKEFFSLSLVLNVSNPLGQLVLEKSRDLNFRRAGQEAGSAPNKAFDVETALELDPGRYRLHLLLLDNFSGKVGTVHEELTVPSFEGQELVLSSVLLSSGAAEAVQNREGDRPPKKAETRAGRAFRSGDELNVYFEIYNLSLDQTTGLNKFRADYSFLQGGAPLIQVPPSATKPSPEKDCRVRVSFRLKNFKPGEYDFRVKVIDELSGKSVIRETSLAISD
jgi:GWxTD domain-containing protein